MSDSIAIQTNAARDDENAPHVVRLGPTTKRVRGVIAGETVVDSTDVLLLFESGYVPIYYFPLEDVRMEFLAESGHRTTCPYKGEAHYWTVKIGDRVAENAAWGYADPVAGQDALAGRVAFYFSKFDHWYEEDEEIFGHTPDPYKRIDIRESHRRLQVVVDGEIVADTTRGRFLFETGVPARYYLPAEDVRTDLLTPTETTTYCPYKGTAVYWTLTLDGKAHEDLVWSYPEPIPECLPIKDYLSFYWTQVDAILIDGDPAPVIATTPPKKTGGMGKPPVFNGKHPRF